MLADGLSAVATQAHAAPLLAVGGAHLALRLGDPVRGLATALLLLAALGLGRLRLPGVSEAVGRDAGARP